MPSFGFIGPSYVSRGKVGECEDLINLCLERIESGMGGARPVNYQLIATPGKVLFCTLSDGPIAAVANSTVTEPSNPTTFGGAGDPHFFAVGGKTLYAVRGQTPVGPDSQGIATTIGTIDKQVINGTGGQLFPVNLIVFQPTFLMAVTPNGNAYLAAWGSAITASSVSSAGVGYAVGDTGMILGGLIHARYTITGVDGSGGVTSYSLSGGTGYGISVNIQTTVAGPQEGNGSGFSIDINTVAAEAWLVYLLNGTDIDSAINDQIFVRSATYMDGYVIISLAPNYPDPARRTFYISNLNDPNIWSPLDFGVKESNPDPNMVVAAAYEILHVGGSQTTELWQNTGNGLFPFQRLPGGGVIDTGWVNPWLWCKMDGTLIWLGFDARGEYAAWQLQGATPVRISNHAIENHWSNFDMSGASVFSYVENGHVFACFHFPIPDETWVYDSTIGPAIGWHKRLSWDGAVFHADRGRYHGFTANMHCVGDPNTNDLYLQSMNFVDENCNCIRRIRVCPHLVDEKKRHFYTRFRMYMLTGACPPTLTPVCSLRLSNDGGYTWGSYLDMPMGTTGQYKKMVEWYHLGMARDRVFEWSCCEPLDIVIADAYIESLPGDG